MTFIFSVQRLSVIPPHGLTNSFRFRFRENGRAEGVLEVDFPEDKQTKTPFEMSKHPSFKLPNDNRLKLLLRDCPKEKFYK